MSSILEKYGSVKKKRKKTKEGDGKKKGFKGGGFRIVEQEGFGFNTGNFNDDSSDDGQTVEELPQIAGVVDERPREMQLEEEKRQGKWKQLVQVDSPNLRRQRHDSSEEGDSSPPRRRQRHDSDNDQLPPRRIKRQDSDDMSPPRRRQRHDSDGDLSPPRASGRGGDDSDLSPPRPGRSRDSNGDLSPPRRKRRDSGDLSPPRSRRRAGSNDLSPPRRGRDDRSPPRRRDRDLSPPRGHRRSPPPRHGGRQTSQRAIALPEIIQTDDKGALPKTTLDGKKSGLQRAADLREEMNDYRKRETALFSNLDENVSGRNAVTKFRDRATGKERDLNMELAKKEEEDRIAAEKKKQYDKWGKGLKQVQEQETRITEALHEVSKPLARYADDRDLDEYLKNQDRDGDPMLKFIKSKRKDDTSLSQAPTSSRPQYNGPLPLPNRFGILPGYRWDGVDRSSGYEKEWHAGINSKKAFKEESYKWSVEDL